MMDIAQEGIEHDNAPELLCAIGAAALMGCRHALDGAIIDETALTP